MQKSNQLMKKSQLIRNYRFSFGKCSLLIPLTFIVCLAFSPPARAICNDGCGTGNNTYQGDGAGTTGSDNTAVGFNALFSNNIGYQNTAVGSLALFGNTDGYNNTAVGKTALQSNTTAIDCTAVGVAALQQNTV